MPKITIDLTQKEADALIEMKVVNIELYLKSIVNIYVEHKFIDEFRNKSNNEKENLLRGFKG